MDGVARALKTAGLLRPLISLAARAATLVATMSSPTYAQQQIVAPIEVYASIARSIESANGRVLLDLNAGIWRTSVPHSTLFWDIHPSTRATVDFRVENSSLRDATMALSPPIHLTAAPYGIAGTLHGVVFNSDGDATRADFRLDPRSNTNENDKARIYEHLEMNRRPEELLSGDLFMNADRAFKCDAIDANCQPASDLVRRLRVQSPGGPGLEFRLKDKSVLYLTGGNDINSPPNFFVVSESSRGVIDDLDYFVNGTRVRGRIRTLQLGAYDGNISAAEVDLKLGSGTRVEFDHVSFERNEAGHVSLDAFGGQLSGALAGGSMMTLARTTNGLQSQLRTRDRSTSNILGLRIEAMDRHIKVSIGAGSRIQLKVQDGQLAIGLGELYLGESTIDLEMAAIWSSGNAPQVTGRMRELDLSLVGGRMEPTRGSRLLVQKGRAVASDLGITSTAEPVVTGAFKKLSFSLAKPEERGGKYSVFAMSNGLEIVAKDGSLSTPDSDQPLEFVPGDVFPIGRFDVDVKFVRVSNGWETKPTIALHDGVLTLPVQRARNGALSGRPVTVAGIFDVETDRGPISGRVEMQDGELSGTIDDTTLRGSLEVTIPDGAGYRFATNGQRKPINNNRVNVGVMGEREMSDNSVYPIAVGLNLAEKLKLVIPIEVRSGSVSGQADFKVKIDANVLAGGGDHGDVDGHKNVAEDAPLEGDEGECANCQEVFWIDNFDLTDPFGVCDLHVYLRPHEYRATFTASVTLKDGCVDVAVSDVEMVDSDVDYERDGCSLEGYAGAVVAIATSTLQPLLPGMPLPLLGGAVAVAITRDIQSNRMKGFVNTKFAERVNGWGTELHCVVPDIP